MSRAIALRALRIRRRRRPAGRRVLGALWIAVALAQVAHVVVEASDGGATVLVLITMPLLTVLWLAVLSLTRYWRAVEGTAHDRPVNVVEWGLIAWVWLITGYLWVMQP
jgi:hypothetical protein